MFWNIRTNNALLLRARIRGEISKIKPQFYQPSKETASLHAHAAQANNTHGVWREDNYDLMKWVTLKLLTLGSNARLCGETLKIECMLDHWVRSSAGR